MGMMIIDGMHVEFTDEANVLDVIRKAGIDLPTLCYVSELSVYGACRLCTVKDDEGRYFASCTVKPRDGMNIQTNTPELHQYRRLLVELLLAAHDRDCTTCHKNGSCHLQELAERMGMRHVRFKSLHDEHPVDLSSNCIVRDPNKCILCGECVRVCRELVGVNALVMAQKGNMAYVMPNGGKDMSETKCVSCGNCVSVCPVGALMPKSQQFFRQWETQKVVTTCAYCGVGCQIEYSVRNGKIVDAKPANGPSNQGLLCVKGKFAFDFINHKDRLKYPMIRKNGKLVRASWEEALNTVAKKINEVKSEFGPDAIAGFSSARTVNEDNYLFQKFLRAAVGTNNVDHCARL